MINCFLKDNYSLYTNLRKKRLFKKYVQNSNLLLVHRKRIQNLTLLTVLANAFPWMVAISSSSFVGMRDPSDAANVPAPQGEPSKTCHN